MRQRQAVQKAGAGATDVERERASGAQRMLNARREVRHVTALGPVGQDQKIELRGADLGALQRALGGLYRHEQYVLVVARDATRVYPDFVHVGRGVRRLE